MPIELVSRTFNTSDVCGSCGKGPLFHGEGHPFCFALPVVATDGNRDGIYSHGDMVTAHAHRAPEGQPWARCAVCRLGQAAHTEAHPVYAP